MLFESDRHKETGQKWTDIFNGIVGGGSGHFTYDYDTNRLCFSVYEIGREYNIDLQYALEGGILTDKPSEAGELDFILKRVEYNGDFASLVAVITELHKFIEKEKDELKEYIDYERFLYYKYGG
jgi:hypothetical protein